MINYFWVEIKGKNIKIILNQIFKNKVNIINIKYYDNKVHLKVSYDDYKKIKEIKTACEIKVIKTSGKKKMLEDILKYKTSIIVFIISIFFIILLSNLTLFIRIDTNNNDLKNEIKNQLKANGITIFSIKKDFRELNKITRKIKIDRDDIEWIEIENKGVTTNVKIIQRIENEIEYDSNYKDIVAEKNGYIRKVYSRRGQLLKNIDDYVRKGEVIISGNIFKNDKLVDRVRADGKVYAEVWYLVKLNESIKYMNLKEEMGTKKLVINILGKEMTIFKIKKQISKEKIRRLFNNNVFCLYIKDEKNYEAENKVYEDRKLVKILETRAKKSIEESLKKDEYIIKQKTLKKTKENGKIYLEVFFIVYEDIAKESEIKKIENTDEENEE